MKSLNWYSKIIIACILADIAYMLFICLRSYTRQMFTVFIVILLVRLIIRIKRDVNK